MADQKQLTDGPEPGQTRYFILPRDEVFARLQDGWRSQVWQPKAGVWADYPDLDIAGEASELSEADAREVVGSMFGEFGKDPFADEQAAAPPDGQEAATA